MEGECKETMNPPCKDTDYQVNKHSEIYEEVDGQYQYTFSQVLFEQAGNMYLARSGIRLLDRAKLKPTDLTDITLIPIEAYAPLCEPTQTILDPLPSECHIKRPKYGSYDSAHPTRISDDFLAEIQTCEYLKLHPHPNLAQYLGCQVQDGRVVGMCFAKYDQSLADRVNPGYHGKRAFKGCGWNAEECRQFLEGVEAGLKHLHSLHLVHNDVNPSNIMFGPDNQPVIIDFGSCRPFGEDISQGGRTYEWYDETVRTSRPENDMDAVAEIREWMSDKPVKRFQFKE